MYLPATDHFGLEILRCEVGSSAHGTSVGTDDLDLMGVVIPTPERVLGLDEFEHYIYRTALERQRLSGVKLLDRMASEPKSEPGDVDLTLYSLRKFLGLAKKGNPSILMMFFAPTLTVTPQGHRLRGATDLFRSKEAGYRFLGYMRAQRERLIGERGQKRTNRPELVEQHGYDTKYAYHILRLGFQGNEFMRHGRITMPIPAHVRDFLLAVRGGKYTEEQALQFALELEQELTEIIETSSLPKHAAPEPIDSLSVDLHTQAWAEAGLIC